MPEPRRVQRPLSRAIAALALLVLGAVAAVRLPLGYLPSWTFPELGVDLVLPESEPLDRVARLYLTSLEGSIRSLGGVRDMLGEVNGGGGRFRVRLAPGIDVEKKSARLDSELEALRRRLPAGATLSVQPAGQSGGELSTVIWLAAATHEEIRPATGERAADPRLVEALRSLPEVRRVEVAGEREREVRIRARDSRQDAAALRRAATGGRRELGHVLLPGSRRAALLTEGATGWLPERPVRRAVAGDGESAKAQRVSTLGAVAELELRREDPQWLAHVDGRAGRVLMISRDHEASPLALRRAVLRELAAAGYGAGPSAEHGEAHGEARFLVDEAEPLLLLLRRLALGLGLAVFLFGAWGGLAHGWTGLAQAAVAPLALAGALNALWLVGPPALDVTTLPAVAVAVAAALLVHALRSGGGRDAPWLWAPGLWTPWLWMTLAVALLPVAVILAGGPLGAFLAAPAKVYAVAVGAAALAVFLVPAPSPRPPSSAFTVLRFLWRRPWAVLLFAGTLTYILLVLFGGALLPRPGRLAPLSADLTVRLSFVEGTTITEAEALVERAEAVLAGRREIAGQWSVFDRRGATLGLSTVAEERPLPRLRGLAARLEILLSGLGATVRATPLAGAGGQEALRFDDALVEKPTIAEDQRSYRLLLRGPDAAALRLALERIEAMPRRSSYLRDKVTVRPQWTPPAEQWLLVPLPGADPARVDAAADRIAARASLPLAEPLRGLPGDPRPVRLRVAPAKAPERLDDPPELAAVFAAGGTAAPSAPGELFSWRESRASPTLLRQRGSFVLPVTLQFQRVSAGQRPYLLDDVHGQLLALAWPAGVDRELPALERQRFPRSRLRLFAVASALPLLLLGLGICRLDSLLLGLAAAVPPAVGVAATAPLFEHQGGADELALVAVAASICAVWAFAAEIAAATRVARPSPLAVGPGYRWLSQRLPMAALAAVAWLALLFVPTLGLAGDRHAWVTALRGAGVAGAVGTAGAFLALPVLLRAVDRLRFFDRAEARRRAAPPAWQEPGRLELEARSLTKVYGSNGRDDFRALSGVDVTLEPGIIGLLGPNGAGKTTFLRTLCGLLEPSRGQVLFRGVPVTPANLPRYRRLVGFLPQSFNAYEGFTVEAFLDFWALERGLRDPGARQREIAAVLEQVDLASAAGRKVRDLSGGMRRRIGIARALLGWPPILIVDEPTTGLDVESRQRLRDSLLRVAEERIILFSTHIASDVAAAATRILVLDAGRLVFDGPAEELIEEARGRVFERLLSDQELRDFSGRYRVTTRVRTLDGIRVRAVAAPGQEPAGELVRPNLEEAYLAKLGKGPRPPVALGASLGRL